MVDKIKDPLLLGSTAMMHIGAIISASIVYVFIHSMLTYFLIMGVIVLIDILILFRCAQAADTSTWQNTIRKK